MACIDSQGRLTSMAITLLQAIQTTAATPEEVADETGQPLFMVRSGLRQLARNGYTQEENGQYSLTDLGREQV